MISFSSTRKDQICQLTTFLDYPQLRMRQSLQPLTCSSPDCFNFNKRNLLQRTSSPGDKWDNGQHTKKDINQYLELCKKTFSDKDGLIWFRLTDYNYPRTALFLLHKYQKEAL